jgi:hypothetical protein
MDNKIDQICPYVRAYSQSLSKNYKPAKFHFATVLARTSSRSNVKKDKTDNCKRCTLKSAPFSCQGFSLSLANGPSSLSESQPWTKGEDRLGISSILLNPRKQESSGITPAKSLHRNNQPRPSNTASVLMPN